MKKIHLKSTGQIMPVDDTTAEHLVSAGYAEYVDKRTPNKPGEIPELKEEKIQVKTVSEAENNTQEKTEQEIKTQKPNSKNSKKKGGKAGK